MIWNGNELSKLSKLKKKLNKNAAILPYQLIDEILYFNKDERGLRLYIPSNMDTIFFDWHTTKWVIPGTPKYTND